MLRNHLNLKWEIKIGLEIHAQLQVTSKLFSPSEATSSGKYPPNSRVSLFDASFPGTLPILNKNSVKQAIRAALAFKCKINRESYFERKHYFYPDLPLGYQITQQRKPIAENGVLLFDYVDSSNIDQKGAVSIDRIQIEQDSGKSLHGQDDYFTLVDLNRAGVSLIEIVFAPTLTDPQQAVGALKTTQSILRHIGICDGSLESGSMRCDVNISVGYPESNSTDRRRVRTEIKNLNSFESVRDASTFELNRHIELLESGSDILSETRYYDTFTKRTTRLRTKETSIDYRFLPEPDLPILHVTDEEIHEIQSCMPELPHETLLRLQREYDLSSDQIELLISKQAITYFENVCDYYSSKRNQDNLECRDHDIKTIYNWMMSELLGHLNALNLNFQNCPVMPTQLCDTVLLYLDKKISAPSAKRLTAELFDLNDPKKTAEQFASDLNIFQVNDDSHIEQICYQVLNDEKNRKKLDELLRGNSNILQFFMGGIMRSCQNKVDPKDVKRILQKVVDEMTSK